MNRPIRPGLLLLFCFYLLSTTIPTSLSLDVNQTQTEQPNAKFQGVVLQLCNATGGGFCNSIDVRVDRVIENGGPGWLSVDMTVHVVDLMAGLQTHCDRRIDPFQVGDRVEVLGRAGSKPEVDISCSPDYIIKLAEERRPPCVVVTATYGTVLAGEIEYARYVRDGLIGSTATGKMLVDAWNRFYYSWSPSLASLISRDEFLRRAFSVILLPLLGIIHVTAISFLALAPLGREAASVLAFSCAAMLSIAIYLGVPAFVILRIGIREGSHE